MVRGMSCPRPAVLMPEVSERLIVMDGRLTVKDVPSMGFPSLVVIVIFGPVKSSGALDADEPTMIFLLTPEASMPPSKTA